MDERSTVPQPTPEHMRFLEALPFYVNGTLDAQEKAWVDAYLQANPEAVNELRLTEGFREVIKSSRSEVPEDVRIERLLTAWQADKAAHRASATAGQRLGRWVDWWRQAWAVPKPLAGLAVAALLAQLVGLLSLLPSTPEESQYRGMRGGASTACYGGPGWRIVLDPAAPHAEVLLLLRRADVALVNGPSEAGELWLMPRALSDNEAVTQMLKASALVEELIYLPKLQEASCRQR